MSRIHASQGKWFLLGEAEREALEVIKLGVFSEPETLELACGQMSRWLKNFKAHVLKLGPGKEFKELSMDGLAWPTESDRGIKLIVSCDHNPNSGELILTLSWKHTQTDSLVDTKGVFNVFQIGERGWSLSFLKDNHGTSMEGPAHISVGEQRSMIYSAAVYAANIKNGRLYDSIKEASEKHINNWTFDGYRLSLHWADNVPAMRHPWFEKQFALWEARELKESIGSGRLGVKLKSEPTIPVKKVSL